MIKLFTVPTICLLINTFNIYSQAIPYSINEVTIVPNFVGGQPKLNDFVSTNFVTPEVEGITGTIKISFVIETDGTLTNIKIIQSIGEDFTQAAKKVFQQSPKWLPGELNGEKVRVIMNYPIVVR